MGRSNQNFVYTPHKRRGPISAEFTSPGPAAISLPGTIGSKFVLKYHIPDFKKRWLKFELFKFLPGAKISVRYKADCK